jgi:hypothetical protein
VSLVDSIVTLLEADTGAGGVATLLTGGIYTYEETGRLGINRNKTPNAFDTTTKILKPCAVVRDSNTVSDGVIADDVLKNMSYQESVRIWLYNDGDAGYSTINTVQDRLFALLHGVRVSGCVLRWQVDIKTERDPSLNNACMARSDFLARGVR